MKVLDVRNLLAILLFIPISLAYAEPLSSPLSTNGSQIVDSNHKPVRILSIGMWLDNNGSHRMAEIVEAGFNTIRLDWSNRSIGRLADLDRLINAAEQQHLKVILDDHSNESGAPGAWKPCYAQQANGLWYDSGGASNNTDGCGTPGTVTDPKFIADWQTIAKHYANNSTVIGYDLWNEPLGYPGMATWEDGARNPGHNIRYMCERAGNAILAIDPTKLIICEAPMNGQTSLAAPSIPAPGGDLSMAGKYPVQLSVPHKLVYSVHDYPTDISGYKPDSGPERMAQLTATWGYLVRDHIAPVWIGEMGADMTLPGHRLWAQTLIDYANGKAENGPTFHDDEQGIGINWWFAGYDPNSNPPGIFNKLGQIDRSQQAIYSQFKMLPRTQSGEITRN